MLYNDHFPANCPDDLFYLRPLNKPKSDCWYTCTPVGYNWLSCTVSSLFEAAGVTGHFTNHSGQLQLFDAGIDKQLIMDQTGHSSSAGVRSYKMITDSIKETSDILNASAPQTKKENLDSIMESDILGADGERNSMCVGVSGTAANSDNKENNPIQAANRCVNLLVQQTSLSI